MKIQISNICLLFCFLLAGYCVADTTTTTERSTVTTRPPRIRFRAACSETQINEKLFDGTCTLKEENFLPKLKEILNSIFEYNSSATIDNLFRDELFYNSTAYFEEKYSNNSDYINKLDEFKNMCNKIADKIAVTTKSTNVNEFYLAYIKSGLKDVATKILTEAQELIELDFDLYAPELKCNSDSGFCPKTSDIFNITFTDVIGGLSVTDGLLYLLENSFKFFKESSLFLFKDRDSITEFINALDKQGTGTITVGELKKALNTSLVGFIVNYYDKDSQYYTFRKPKTTKTTRTTTLPNKVLAVTAVPSAVVYTIPILMVVLGIVAATALVFAFRPLPNFGINDVELNEKKMIRI